jgi:nucleotide-binding universal stress UspA family protein
MSPSRILVPVDFSVRSRVALRYAVEAARASAAEVDLLHVVSAIGGAQLALNAWLGRSMKTTSDGEVDRAWTMLDDLATVVPHDGITLRPRIEAGDPAATIVRIATEDEHAQIVICTHGRYGLADLLLGSVAKAVLTCAPCPLTLLRADAEIRETPKPQATASRRRAPTA